MRSAALVLLWMGLAIPRISGASESIVLATSRTPLVLAQISEHAEWQTPFLPTITVTDLQARLSGIATPNTTPTDELENRLAAADKAEAEYDTETASTLRNSVIDAYEHQAIPDSGLSLLAARALHDRAAAELNHGDKRIALANLVEAIRRFPDVSLDTRRHPPQMYELFKRAYAAMQATTKVRVTIATTKAAVLRLDGRSLNRTEGIRTFEVPAGRYLLWASDATQTSLMHPIEVGPPQKTIEVDFAVESQLVWRPTVAVRCAPTCEGTLAALAKRANVDRAVGVRESPRGGVEALIVSASGEATVQPIIDYTPPMQIAASPPPPRGVSAWSFMPLGIAQFSQGRPVVGSVIATATLGAIAWNVLETTSRHQGHDDDSSTRQNVSAGVLIGVVVIGVAEGVVHDVMSGSN